MPANSTVDRFLQSRQGTFFKTMIGAMNLLLEVKEVQTVPLVAFVVFTDGCAHDHSTAASDFAKLTAQLGAFQAVTLLMVGVGAEHNERQLMAIFDSFEREVPGGRLLYVNVPDHEDPEKFDLAESLLMSARKMPALSLGTAEPPLELMDAGPAVCFAACSSDAIGRTVFVDGQETVLVTKDDPSLATFVHLCLIKERLRQLTLKVFRTEVKSEVSVLAEQLRTMQLETQPVIDKYAEAESEALYNKMVQLRKQIIATPTERRSLNLELQAVTALWKKARHITQNEQAVSVRELFRDALEQARAKVQGSLSADDRRALLANALTRGFSAGKQRRTLERANQAYVEDQLPLCLEKLRRVQVQASPEGKEDAPLCQLLLSGPEELLDSQDCLVFVARVENEPAYFALNPSQAVQAKKITVCHDPVSLQFATSELIAAKRNFRASNGVDVNAVVGFFPYRPATHLMASMLPVIACHLGTFTTSMSCGKLEAMRMLLVPVLSLARRAPTEGSVLVVRRMLAGLRTMAEQTKTRPFKAGLREIDTAAALVPVLEALKMCVEEFVGAGCQTSALFTQAFQPLFLLFMVGGQLDDQFVARQTVFLFRECLHLEDKERDQVKRLMVFESPPAKIKIGLGSRAGVLAAAAEFATQLQDNPVGCPATATHVKVISQLVPVKDLRYAMTHLFGDQPLLSDPEFVRHQFLIALELPGNSKFSEDKTIRAMTPAELARRIAEPFVKQDMARAAALHAQVDRITRLAIRSLSHHAPSIMLTAALQQKLDRDKAVVLGSIYPREAGPPLAGSYSGMAKTICMCPTCPEFLRPVRLRGHLQYANAIDGGSFPHKHWHRVVRQAMDAHPTFEACEQAVQRHYDDGAEVLRTWVSVTVANGDQPDKSWSSEAACLAKIARHCQHPDAVEEAKFCLSVLHGRPLTRAPYFPDLAAVVKKVFKHLQASEALVQKVWADEHRLFLGREVQH